MQNFLKKFAAQQWELFSFKKEWGTVIVLVALVKIATCVISVVSGYTYINNLFYGFLNSEQWAQFFSVAALILIEGLNWFMLDKAFKFLLRQEYKVCAMPLIAALLIFGLSFHISANGIAILTADKADLATDINGKFNTMAENTKTDIESQIADIDQNIKDIKSNPEHWSNGKRSILSPEQNATIQKLYERKSELRTRLNEDLKTMEIERKNALAENATNTTDQADKFYTVVGVIMVVQFCCNLFLMFCWKKIYGEEEPGKVQCEQINTTFANFAKIIESGCSNVIAAKATEFESLFDMMKGRPLGKLRVVEESEADETESETPLIAASATTHEHPKKIKIGGFITDVPEETETAETATETPTETPTTETPYNAPGLHVPTPEETPTETPKKQEVKRAKETEPAVKLTPAKKVFAVSGTTPKFTNCQYVNCGKPLTDDEIKHGAKFCEPRHRLAQWKLDHPKKKMNLSEDQAQD